MGQLKGWVQLKELAMSPLGPHWGGGDLLKESAEDINKVTYYPVNWLKFISSVHSKTSMTEPSIPGSTPVQMAYSPLASMNHQWTINFHRGYPPPCALIPGQSIPTSLPTLCNLPFGMFNSGVAYTPYQ